MEAFLRKNYLDNEGLKTQYDQNCLPLWSKFIADVMSIARNMNSDSPKKYTSPKVSASKSSLKAFAGTVSNDTPSDNNAPSDWTCRAQGCTNKISESIKDMIITQMRDSWMLEHFNTNGWKCKQLVNDRSMFKFTSPRGKSIIMCVHSDDVDMVCEDPQDGVLIADAFNTKFGGDKDGIKMCDPKFMLGVQRTVTRDEETGTTYLGGEFSGTR